MHDIYMTYSTYYQEGDIIYDDDEAYIHRQSGDQASRIHMLYAFILTPPRPLLLLLIYVDRLLLCIIMNIHADISRPPLIMMTLFYMYIPTNYPSDELC